MGKKQQISDLTESLTLAIMLLADAKRLITQGDSAQLLTAGGKPQLLVDIKDFFSQIEAGLRKEYNKPATSIDIGLEATKHVDKFERMGNALRNRKE